MSAHPELGRRRGIWTPDSEVQAYLLNGWSIVDDTLSRGDVLMAPPVTRTNDHQGRKFGGASPPS